MLIEVCGYGVVCLLEQMSLLFHSDSWSSIHCRPVSRPLACYPWLIVGTTSRQDTAKLSYLQSRVRPLWILRLLVDWMTVGPDLVILLMRLDSPTVNSIGTKALAVLADIVKTAVLTPGVVQILGLLIKSLVSKCTCRLPLVGSMMHLQDQVGYLL